MLALVAVIFLALHTFGLTSLGFISVGWLGLTFLAAHCVVGVPLPLWNRS